MSGTLDILWRTFQAVGVASAAASAAAACLLAVGAVLGRRRLRTWLAACLCAVAGVLLAAWTSAGIRAIEVDRSAEVQAAEQSAAREAAARLRSRAAAIRFSEDTSKDRLDVAGVSVAEERGVYERAVEQEMAKIPAYRARGRQARAEGRGREPDDEAGADEPGGSAESARTEAPPPGLRLPEAELAVADRFDRWNRLLAGSLLGLAACLVVCEYVRRLRTPFDAAWPLPLAGTFIDPPSTRRAAERLPLDSRGVALAGFLAAAVRKGETFLLFAEADPFPGTAAVERLAVGPLRSSVTKRVMEADDAVRDPTLGELAFESAWFGEGVSVVAGDRAAAVAALERIVELLRSRHRSRAFARRTLNLVWAIPGPLPSALDEIGWLCPPANVRLVVCEPDAVDCSP